MRASHFLPALNGGELSPLLLARIDLAKHGVACQRLSNFLPLPEGPVTRRPGSQYLGDTEATAERSWLVPFVFGVDDAWLIEIGNLVMRFWVGDGIVQDPELDVPKAITIGTPWLSDSLNAGNGTLALSFAQLRDRMWFVGGGREPYLLERRAATDWKLQPFRPADGPFGRENVDESTKVYVAGETAVGSEVTLHVVDGGSPIFRLTGGAAQHIRLFLSPDFPSRPWVAGADVDAGDIRESSGRYYRALNSGESGAVRPIHNEGVAFDASDGGVEWQFLHASFGVVQVHTPFGASPTMSAGGKVVVALPLSLANGEAAATARWAVSAWDGPGADGWPSVVGFGFNRLVFGRGNELWFSRADDFFSFADRSPGEILADDGMRLTLSGEGVTEINWLEEGPAGLVVGTDGGEFLVTKANSAEVFGSVTDATRNAQVIRHTTYGSRRVPPTLAHGRVVMVDATRRKLRELDRRIEVDRLQALDLTAMASHILSVGVTWQAWQSAPDNLLWLGLADGSMVTCTYLPEQEIVAFARHHLGGGGFVEHGAVIPEVGGGASELWLTVRREMNGATRRTVERLFPRWRGGEGIGAAASRHLDAALVYEGPPVETVDGGAYLAGQTLPAVVDGFDVAGLIFDDLGRAELPFEASVVVVGWPYSSEVELLVPNAGGGDGPGIGKKRRTRELIVTVIESADQFRAGLAGKLRSIDERPGDLALGQAVALVTNDIRVPVDLGWQRRPKLGVAVDGPLPFTLAAVLQRMDVSE